MTAHVPPLNPWPLARLLDRIAHELDVRNEIFGLPARRFYKMDPDLDLALDLGRGRAATPVGPAAGPHTQLAENLVLGWLAGARSFELKTVQILDELEIERPCIDMEHVGYNIEWSQELTLEASLEEYAKSWLLLEVLRHWEPVRKIIGDPGPHTFELSVGYDLAGLQTERMENFITGMLDASDRIDRLRAEIGGPFASLANVPVSGRMVTTATLSTFHGCPPDEIEAIVKHLMSAHELDVTVKLNPTLLGPETVASILHDRLGYRDVQLRPEVFENDLKWERGLELIAELEAFAAERGREFGIKLTNTLVVANTRGVMPGQEMYLSGQPLHVMAMTLLDRLHTALPGKLRLGTQEGAIPVAFSAGIDKDNLTEAVALGLSPVTICSDLLKPGGYGRLAQGLKKMGKQMKADRLSDLDGLRRWAEARAKASGARDAVQAMALKLADPEGCARYRHEANSKPLRQVDTQLQHFDCVACTNCVTVCPNGAFMQVPTGDLEGLQAKAQYLVLAELCNDCGNCTTFCPEVGQPHVIKPRLYHEKKAWMDAGKDGYLLGPDGNVLEGTDEADSARIDLLVGGKKWPLA